MNFRDYKKTAISIVQHIAVVWFGIIMFLGIMAQFC